MNPKDLVGAKKAPLDGVPVAGAIFSAPAHAHGHAKYGLFNWRLQPVQVMTYLGAVQRHIGAYIDGQDLAEDTGIHHLAHALAGLNIVADAMGMGNLIDNRPPKGPAADMLRAQDRSHKHVAAYLPDGTGECVDCGATAPPIATLPPFPFTGCPPNTCTHCDRDRDFAITSEQWGEGDGEVRSINVRR